MNADASLRNYGFAEDRWVPRRVNSMEKQALARLRCPVCVAELELVSFEEELVPSRNGGRPMHVVREGLLLCDACKFWFPITCYIPVMLVFRTKLHADFIARMDKARAAPAGYEAPNGAAEPGEECIQQTFTEEWAKTSGDDLSFTYTKEDLRGLHKRVWLKWEGDPPPDVRAILNVGCGLGVESAVLSDIVSGADVYGIDLNLSLLGQGNAFKSHPSVHLVIASLFHLPFERRSFDLVYSQGVLHHTHSTHEAFKSISVFVRPEGLLFIWVYALEDHLVEKGAVGTISKVSHAVEWLLRPVLSRSPPAVRSSIISFGTLLAHPLVLTRVRHRASWKMSNTNHALRDFLTPKFSFKHSTNEVIEWFEQSGFTYDMHSPSTYRKLFGKKLWGIGVLGRRIEGQKSDSAAAE